MRGNKNNRTSRLLLIVIVIILLVYGTLGFLLIRQSSSALIFLIQKRMLDTSNTAAAILDGDALASLTAEDSESPAYRRVMELLTYYQDNIELKYISCINDDGDGTFSFSVDPTVEDPAEFGLEVVCTDALVRASRGVPAVDDKPYEDEWGRFYSAYSPVFKSDGTIGGIVAVDFDADWYDAQVWNLGFTISSIGVISLIAGVMIVIVITRRDRKRNLVLNGQLNELAFKVEELLMEIEKGMSPEAAAEAVEHVNERLLQGEDEDALGVKILSMQDDIRAHIELIREQAYLDGMTGVGNKTAYIEKIKHIEKLIADKTASFAVAVFDMNGLKNVNDNFGHECGDLSLIAIAECLKKIFGKEQIYRIGGDEFIALIPHSEAKDIEAAFVKLDGELDRYNKSGRQYDFELSVSKGFAVYDPAEDGDFKTVFERADLAMYDDKKAFYLTHGDRRRH